MSDALLPTFQDVEEAAARLAGRVHRTPVFTSCNLDEMVGAHLFFKCENLQKTGAFKYRGASNAVLCLTAETAARGVVTHSSGNHGAALARAARERGVPAWIVMPENSSEVKRQAVASYGGQIVLCPPTQEGRERTASQVGEETGATLVHPYEDPRVIAGQGTAVCELLQQVENLDFVLAPIGGGGLLSGTSLAVAHLAPKTRVIGVEPAGADDAFRSLAAGAVTPRAQVTTVADGLRATLGSLAFAILQQLGVSIVTVNDSEILNALRVAWQRLKLVIEPSAAVPLAALLEHRLAVHGARVGIILSGGNLDLPRGWPEPADGSTAHDATHAEPTTNHVPFPAGDWNSRK